MDFGHAQNGSEADFVALNQNLNVQPGGAR
jgi:hypothetical protein